MSKKIAYVGAHFSNSEELVNSFKSALRALGLYMRSDPRTNGSSEYGFVLSKKRLSRAAIRRNVQKRSKTSLGR